MAGSLVVASTSSAIGVEWEVEYSRFFNYPSLTSSCPSSLDPLTDQWRHRFRGTWISSSSSIASLKLTPDPSISDYVLTVTFLQKIHEEHYISKLNFTWPHVACVSGFPTRGSRVVFVGYRDCTGQIQKFALRFSTIHEIETFMNPLKEIMGMASGTGLLSDNYVSEISSQSEYVPSDEPQHRATEDWNRVATIDTSAYKVQSDLNYEVAQNSNSQEILLNCDPESIFTALPPSFTSLLMSCHPEKAQPIVSREADQPDLKSQIMRYLGDPSFQDILGKVEKVLSEMDEDTRL
ncbi:protein POOR HOMOLOGOUS SYNAPSIS 1 isoform X2 [Diospyros lotus]|uniref:protein POOR HOMOLOGOUS SYNAPSIS 1 isoform X2 n=1 Tax=Diospyros lotus TaxID=55363 RepID=UPI002258E7CE|nr:protein POOR HOMOLOGOUS SYNAPSIS 1 isoform X2 [Diospyros lotus]